MEYRTELSDLYLRQQRMRNTREMLWPVDIDIGVGEGRVMHVDMVCSLQPDQKVPGKYWVRLPNWNVMTFQSDEHLDAMPLCVNKTAMKQFFTDQSMVAKAEQKGQEAQLLLGSWLEKHGQLVPFSHEPFSEEQTAFYHLEDVRSRRADYEWGKPVDPLDKHRPGKMSRSQLIEGEIPVDVGSVYVDWDEECITLDTKGRDDTRILGDLVRDGRVHLLDYMSGKKCERLFCGAITLDMEPELMYVGLPANFSSMRRMSTIFRNCKMANDVRKQLAKRLWNAPYWRVKDKRRQRWYVYSYDWRLEGRKFSHSVVPIGHIEPGKFGYGYYFCAYSWATIAARNNQSLYIADYRLQINWDLCLLLDLDKDCIGKYLHFSVYNDWAMAVYREMTAMASALQLAPSYRQRGLLERIEGVLTHA